MEEKKKIPLNIDLFTDLIQGGYYYVDKTLLVKHLLDSGSEVTLYARPRRFGKSLNLSMLDCFFNIDKRGQDLFKGTAILQAGENYTSEMGRYPVVKLSLKEMKQPDFDSASASFRKIIQDTWGEHRYLAESPKLPDYDLKLVKGILAGEKGLQELALSILDLTRLLKLHHGAPTVLLIDEYDVPLEAAYTGGYYDQVLALIRTLMSSACKDNPHLRLAVHTGCLRIARESIYTGFNNPVINTILSFYGSDCFGFTDEEVRTMLEYYGLGDLMPKVREWYDGYRFGDAEIYNPWSLLHFAREACIKPQYAVRAYWMNTSGNDLVTTLLQQGSRVGAQRSDLEKLLDGKTVPCTVNENVNYSSLKREPDAIWNLLLFTGYLKPTEVPDLLTNNNRVPLRLVNQEIACILRQKIQEWYVELYHSGRQAPLVQALEAGKPDEAEMRLEDLLQLTVSYHDREENFHHGFLAGLLAGAEGRECLSNRESGDGRSDLQLLAEDHSSAVVIEVKEAPDGTPEALEKAAAKALRQALERDYGRLLRRRYAQVHVYGVACHAKLCRILMAPEK